MPKKQKYTLLTAEEEKLLIGRIRAGDRRALDWFVNSNIRLVHKIASKHKGKLEYDDLVQEGQLGLLTAIDKFDPERGHKFSTVAYWWVEQAITRAIGDKARTIRLPIHVVEKLNRFRWKYLLLEAEKGREPNLGELVEFTQLPSDKVQLFLNYMSGSLVSLDQPIGDGNDTLGAKIAEDSPIDAGELVSAREVRRSIDRALDDYLNEREKQILCWRFGLIDGKTKTLDQVGARLKITRERVRQIEAVALEKLRKLHPDALEDYRQVDLSVLSSEQGARQMPGISQSQIEIEARRLGLVSSRMALEELGIAHSNPSLYFKQLFAAGLEVAHHYGPAYLYRMEDVRAAIAKLKDSPGAINPDSRVKSEKSSDAKGYSGNLAAMSSSVSQPSPENGDRHSQPSREPAAISSTEGRLIDKVVEQASAMGEVRVREDQVHRVTQQKPSVAARSSNGDGSSDDALPDKPSYNSTLIQTAIYLAGSKAFRELVDEELQEKIVSELATAEFVASH